MKRRLILTILLVCASVAFIAFFVKSDLTVQAGSLSPSRQVAYPPPQYPPPQTATPFSGSPPPTRVAVTPFVTPPIPTSTPEPSEAARAALTYIAQRKGIPVASLVVATDHLTEYPNLRRQFQVVTLLDTRPQGKSYDFLVDLNTGEVIEDIVSIETAEEHAKSEKYGKLAPVLYERLQAMRDDDVVTVMIRVAGKPSASVSEIEAAAIATVTAKYPEAQVAVRRGGKPVDVDDPALADRIYADYVAALDAGMAQRDQPLIEARQLLAQVLEAQGLNIQASDGPSLTVILNKQDILRLERRDDIAAIYLAENRMVILPGVAPPEYVENKWNYWQVGVGLALLIMGLGMIVISRV